MRVQPRSYLLLIMFGSLQKIPIVAKLTSHIPPAPLPLE